MSSDCITSDYEIPEYLVRIGAEIGKGQFGVAYRGKLGGMDVCIKAYHALTDPDLYGLSPGTPEYSHILSDLMHEAATLHTLDHMNVVKFIGIVKDTATGGPKYIVTELGNSTLSAYLRSLGRALTLTEFAGVCNNVLSALAYLQSKGIVHRDLKPDNVLVFTPLGVDGGIVAKVADVGLARLVATSSESAKKLSKAGSPYDTAPEVMLGEGYDTKVDVFSFGIMAAEIVKQFMACSGPGDSDVGKHKVMVGEAADYLLPQSRPLADLLRRCAHNNPADRCSAVDALTILRCIPELRGGMTAESTSFVPAPVSAPVRSATPPSSSGSDKVIEVVAVLEALRERGLSHLEDAVADAIVESGYADDGVPQGKVFALMKSVGLAAGEALRFSQYINRGQSASAVAAVAVPAPASIPTPTLAVEAEAAALARDTQEQSRQQREAAATLVKCGVKGTHLKSIPLFVPPASRGYFRGIALSPDGSQFAVTDASNNLVTVYFTADGSRVRSFGGTGAEPGKFNGPQKLVYHPFSGNILVAECNNKRVQEVKPTGEHVRFIGAGVIDSQIVGVRAGGALIAVGQCDEEKKRGRVMLFDNSSGALVRTIGDWGGEPGQLGLCYSMLFTPDGRHIVVLHGKHPEWPYRLSMFTLTGVHVKDACKGTFRWPGDFVLTPSGDWIVSDWEAHEILVLSGLDGAVMKRFGSEGTTPGCFKNPAAIAQSSSGQLFVLDGCHPRVQIFE